MEFEYIVSQPQRGVRSLLLMNDEDEFLARDVIYTSRAYAMMPVRLSVCL